MGYILDPTVRFESDATQAKEVHEKQKFYHPCLKFFSEKYNIPNWKVIGLLFGARGTLTKFTINELLKLGLNASTLEDIALNILRDSVHIINYHLYSHLSDKLKIVHLGLLPNRVK